MYFGARVALFSGERCDGWHFCFIIRPQNLTMWKTRISHNQTTNFQGLAFRFVNCHGESKADRKLKFFKSERYIVWDHRNSLNENVLTFKASFEYRRENYIIHQFAYHTSSVTRFCLLCISKQTLFINCAVVSQATNHSLMENYYVGEFFVDEFLFRCDKVTEIQRKWN